MITKQVQIKVNMSLALKEFLQAKANKFDMPIAGYIKHLVLKDVEDMEFPTFEMSKETEKAALEAMKNRETNVTVDNVEDFFNKL